MASEKMIAALNKQINEEFYSHYIYLAMAADLEDKNYEGMANWMKKQSYEEYGHGLKIFQYISDLGGKVELEAIAKPDTTWASPKEIFDVTLEHEKYISECFNKLMDLAIEEKDHATRSFLNWFVTEQVEEVATSENILRKFEMVGDNKTALYMLDKELGARQ